MVPPLVVALRNWSLFFNLLGYVQPHPPLYLLLMLRPEFANG
jgi:hypothetical protein